MSCTTLTKAEAIVRIVDGTPTTPVSVELALIADISWDIPGWTHERIRNSDGSISTAYAPRRIEEQPATLTINGTATRIGTNTTVHTLTVSQTHAGSGSGSLTLLTTDTTDGEEIGTLVTLEWDAGGDAGATDDAFEAEATAELGITPTASGTGVIPVVFPAGTRVQVVEYSGMVTGAVVAASGGAVGTEIDIADLVHHTGQYAFLKSTIGTELCTREEKTLHWEIEVAGQIIRFEHATHQGSVTPEQGKTMVSVNVEAAKAYPKVTAA